MTPLMVKGTLFGLLLLSAAVWDMRNREIPNLIPILLFLCGLIGFRPAASTAGLLLVGGPFLLAAVLIKRDGFAIGGGDVKLMGDGRHRAGEAGGTAAGVHRQCFP